MKNIFKIIILIFLLGNILFADNGRNRIIDYSDEQKLFRLMYDLKDDYPHLTNIMHSLLQSGGVIGNYDGEDLDYIYKVSNDRKGIFIITHIDNQSNILVEKFNIKVGTILVVDGNANPKLVWRGEDDSSSSSNENNLEISQDILSFLSEYFTLNNNQLARRITNTLSNELKLVDYIDGLGNYVNSTDKVLYSLEFFLRNSPNVFGGNMIQEVSIVNAYQSLINHQNDIARYSGSTLKFYIKIKEPNWYGGTSNICQSDVSVKIYPVTRYNIYNEQYTILNEHGNYIEGNCYGWYKGYSFGETESGLYLVEIEKNNNKVIKSAFVPMQFNKTITLILDEKL